ncbi:hypothetical protein GCM10009841_27800 [Microlunatus panaciterrae]
MRALRTEWLTMAIIVLATLVLVLAVTVTTTPHYTSRTRLSVADTAGGPVGSSVSRQRLAAEAEAATSSDVLEGVRQALELELSSQALVDLIQVRQRPGSGVLEITVTDVNPFRAADIANAVGEQLVRQTSTRGSRSRRIETTVLTPALVPMTPTTPRVGLNMALGTLGGLVIGAGSLLLQRRFRAGRPSRGGTVTSAER